MAKGKNSYINVDLDYAEQKLKEWKEYLDANPVSGLEDRTRDVMTRYGPSEAVVATVEAQGKFLQETLKNYLSLLEVVDKLREKEEARIESRGDQKVSSLAQDFMKNRK